MRVYYHPLSPYCRKVLLALYEKNVPFEAEIVNLVAPTARDAFAREVSPLGRIPFAITERGERVPESTILIELLDERYPMPPRLIPPAAEAARATRLADRVGDQFLIDPAAVLLDELSRADGRPDTGAVESSSELVRRGLTWLEERLSMSAYCAGPQLTLGDLSISVGVYDLRLAGWSLAAWPRAARWFAGLLDRPSWQRVLSESEPFLSGWADPARNLPLASTWPSGAASMRRDEMPPPDSRRPPQHLRLL